MRIELQATGTLLISPDSVAEAYALKWWLEQYKIVNVNGVDMVPTRAIVISSAVPLTPHGDSRA